MGYPRYVIHTKPDCPYCERAKTLLEHRRIPYKTESYDSDEARAAFLAKLGGWRTWPVIFQLNEAGQPVKFVGGYDTLKSGLSV